MKNTIIKYFKNRNKKIRKTKKKLENKTNIIQEQAEDIHYLIEQNNLYKKKCLEYERKIKELKKEIKELKG